MQHPVSRFGRTGGASPHKKIATVAAFGLVALLALTVLPLPAAAQEGEVVTTRLTYQDPALNERVPATGVRIIVTHENGEVVGEGTTDEEGVFVLEVPEPAVYTLEIDPATLPEGVTLRDPERTTATVEVDPGSRGVALFALQAGDGPVSEGGGTLRRVLQLGSEGIKLGLFLGMAAIGLSLIFGTTGLVNFAHGEMVTWGMLTAYFFNLFGLAGLFGFMEGWPWVLGNAVELPIAAILAIGLGAAFGWVMDAGIFSRLRRRGVGLIAQLVVTIGISILLRYVYLYLFRGSPRFFRSYAGQPALGIGPIQITPKDLIAVFITIVVLVAVGLVLQRTRIGRAMRAVADNRDLAESSGIDVQRVIRMVWVSGGALAALGGIFIGQADQIQWDLGFRILLLIFAGVILGGLGTAYGALVGCLLVGLFIQLSTLFIPAELKNVGALVLLAVVLLIRPQGVLGRKERVG